ncbi:hypothetical protein BDW75DRAFT_131203 [Aspergillus navahoensis]
MFDRMSTHASRRKLVKRSLFARLFAFSSRVSQTAPVTGHKPRLRIKDGMIRLLMEKGVGGCSPHFSKRNSFVKWNTLVSVGSPSQGSDSSYRLPNTTPITIASSISRASGNKVARQDIVNAVRLWNHR